MRMKNRNNVLNHCIRHDHDIIKSSNYNKLAKLIQKCILLFVSLIGGTNTRNDHIHTLC